MPKVSVIIPVYNVEKYLTQALDSVINQTLRDIEIICIDDCSTDGSLEILQEYAQKDPRITVIKQEKNKGAGPARNAGLDTASGDYIMFLDPDDWYELTACEEAYNQIAKYDNDFVMFNYYYYQEDNGKKSVSNSYINPILNQTNEKNIHLWELTEPFLSSAYTVMQIFSRKFLNQNSIRYDEDLFISEDAIFYFKCIALSDTVSALNSPIYNYRIHNKSATHTRMDLWKELYLSRQKSCSIIKESVHSKEYMRSFIPYLINSIMSWFETWSEKNKKIEKEFYFNIQKMFRNLDKEYCISDYKTYIDYKNFNNIVKQSWPQYKINKLMKNIFSTEYKTSLGINRKVIKILGLKISIKSTN